MYKTAGNSECEFVGIQGSEEAADPSKRVTDAVYQGLRRGRERRSRYSDLSLRPLGKIAVPWSE